MNTKTFPHIVVIGAGFGGLHVAQKLAGKAVRVTLIDKRNYHLFQPLLYQVATAGISPHEIAYPVRAIFQKQKNFSFLMTRVNGVDFERKVLLTDQGEVAYDKLVIAAGASVNYFGNVGLQKYALPLKDVSDAVTLRNHVLRKFELAAQEQDEQTRQGLLTFAAVGGGPTGVESVGALSELIRLVLLRDYPAMDMSHVRVVLLEGSEHLLANLPSALQQNTVETLNAKHVEVRLNARVRDYDGKTVTLMDGTQFPCETLIWSAGVKAASLMNKLGLEQLSMGRVRVLPTLQLPNNEHVYVIGDAAYFEEHGKPLPMVAPVATQQGELAANNIIASLYGKRLKTFHYRDLGSMATIGRNAAVAYSFGMQFRGFMAWAVWLCVHLIGLIGFRNRLIVLINWMWDYFFYDRAVRLITRE